MRSIWKLTCFLLLAGGCASAQTLSFHARRDYTAGADPSSLAVGDFNHDGHLDIAVADATTNAVVILFGAKGGMFGPPTNTGLSARIIAAGDLNHDGKIDLVLTTFGSVSIALGNGDGTFQSPSTIPVPQVPLWVTVIDINKDGNPDIVFANGDVTILYGNGDGTFQGPIAIGAGPGVSYAAIGDLNHDGRLDVAALISDNTTNPGSLTIMLGEHGGFYRVAGKYPAGNGPTAVAIGDLNSDGHKDVLVGNYSDAVLFFPGDGKGKLQTPVNVPIGAMFPATVAIADVTGDGKPDIVTGNFTGSINGNTVTVAAGNGDGTFQAPILYTVDTSISALVLEDLNHDGHLDIACTARNGRVSVLLSDGKGGFLHDATLPDVQNASVLASADFNGDGRPDLVVGGAAKSKTVEVLIATGKNKFHSVHIPIPGSSSGVASGDFNGDGKLDVAASLIGKGKSVMVALGHGDGTFATPATLPLSGPGDAIAVGDFNHDGKLDLAIASHAGKKQASIAILLGNGDGSFQSPLESELPGRSHSIAAADFNGDGNLDLAFSEGQTVGLLLGNGDGTFQASTVLLKGVPFGQLAVADLNADGKPDLAIAGSDVFYGVVWTLLGHGDGTFASNFIFTGAAAYGMTVGDFNGDGKLDLAASNNYDSNIGILLGNGDGSFQSPQFFGTEIGLARLVAIDTNQDGKLDLVAACGPAGLCLLTNTTH